MLISSRTLDRSPHYPVGQIGKVQFPLAVFFDSGKGVFFGCSLVAEILGDRFQPQPRFLWRLLLHSHQVDSHKPRQYCLGVRNWESRGPAEQPYAEALVESGRKILLR